MSIASYACIAALLLTACHGDPAPPPAPQRNHEERARITTVTMQIAAQDVGHVSRSLRAMTRRAGGYVESGTTDRENQHTSFDLRIPASELDSFRRHARELGEVENETESVVDVTGQRRDLGARIRNAQREEERLLALTERAGALTELIALETQLGTVRERIEQMQAQESALGSQIEFATVQVSVYPPISPFWEHPIDSVAGAGQWGLRALGAIAVALASASAAMAPTLACIALFLFAVWRAFKLVRRIRSA